MGLLGRLLGRRRRWGDPLFALATAQVTLTTRHGLEPAGRAGVSFKPLSSSFFDHLQREVEDLLRSAARETRSRVRVAEDGFGYRWVVLEDPDFSDLVSLVHLVRSTFQERGFEGQLLVALFPFRRPEGGLLYWVYHFRRRAFYPFAPLRGQRARDNAYEMRIASKMEGELPLERELERWYPLWGTPLEEGWQGPP